MIQGLLPSRRLFRPVASPKPERRRPRTLLEIERSNAGSRRPRSLTQVQANGQTATSALLASFFAFSTSFTGGVFVAAASMATQNWVVPGAEVGGGPQVVVITNGALLAAPNGPALLTSFYPIDMSFHAWRH